MVDLTARWVQALLSHGVEGAFSAVKKLDDARVDGSGVGSLLYRVA
jgi:hypothetical protein